MSDWRFRGLSLLLSIIITGSAYLGVFSSLARGSGLSDLLSDVSAAFLGRAGKVHSSGFSGRRSGNAMARFASVVQGRAQVVDGDSLRMNGIDIRLYGIDAPELFQTCKSRIGRRYKCGARARDHLRRLVRGRRVSCRRVAIDHFGRMVAICRVNGQDIGQRMVRDGWAVAFVRYSRRYVADERAARVARRGLWQGRFLPPSAWRRWKGR